MFKKKQFMKKKTKPWIKLRKSEPRNREQLWRKENKKTPLFLYFECLISWAFPALLMLLDSYRKQVLSRKKSPSRAVISAILMLEQKNWNFDISHLLMKSENKMSCLYWSQALCLHNVNSYYKTNLSSCLCWN